MTILKSTNASYLLGLIACLPLIAHASSQACDKRNSNTQKKLQEYVTSEGVREHQLAFQEIADANGGNQSVGMEGYNQSVAYIVERVTAAGYDVTLQEFMVNGHATFNILAQTPTGDSNKVVMVGAQLDYVKEGPGINDLPYENLPLSGVPSAHTSFINHGIPSGGLFTGGEEIKTPEQAAIFGGVAGEQFDQCYHLACDTYDNVS